MEPGQPVLVAIANLRCNFFMGISGPTSNRLALHRNNQVINLLIHITITAESLLNRHDGGIVNDIDLQVLCCDLISLQSSGVRAPGLA